jgi:MFS family permease
MLPISVLIVLLSSPVGRLTDRIGPQGPLLSGVVITGIAFLLFARLGVVSDYWSTFFPVTLIYGLGLSLTIVPVTTLAMAALPARYSGIASGLNNAVSRIGQMMAVAIFGSVMLVGFRSTLAERVANLPLAPPARAELMSQARNLGATTPPAGLTPALAAEVKQAIATAFVASFRQVMLISAAISAFSLLILLVMFRGQSSGPPDL